MVQFIQRASSAARLISLCMGIWTFAVACAGAQASSDPAVELPADGGLGGLEVPAFVDIEAVSRGPFWDEFAVPTDDRGAPVGPVAIAPLNPSTPVGTSGYVPVESTPWPQKIIYSSPWQDERVFQVRARPEGNRVRFFFLGIVESQNVMRVYEMLDGERPRIIDELLLVDGAGFLFDSRFNLQIRGNFLYYYVNEQLEALRYRIGSGAPSVFAPQFVFVPGTQGGPFSPSDLPCRYPSPNGRYTALFNPQYNNPAWEGSPDCVLSDDGPERLEVGLTLIPAETGAPVTAFAQAYDGDWSIGQASWAPDSSGIFFDNHGPVACIWRYDIATGALQKAVPDHEAAEPFAFTFAGQSHVAYVQGGTVRVARPSLTPRPDSEGFASPTGRPRR